MIQTKCKRNGPLMAVLSHPPHREAGRPQAADDLADAAARSRDRGCPLALSDGDADLIGIG